MIDWSKKVKTSEPLAHRLASRQMRQQCRAWKRWRLRTGVILHLDPRLGAFVVYRGRAVTLGRQPCRVKSAQGRPRKTARRRQRTRKPTGAARGGHGDDGDPDDPESGTKSAAGATTASAALTLSAWRVDQTRDDDTNKRRRDERRDRLIAADPPHRNRVAPPSRGNSARPCPVMTA
jgi:hypothetical protein